MRIRIQGESISTTRGRRDALMDKFVSGVRISMKRVTLRGVNVNVEKREQWLVISGKVASQSQRTMLFEAVPRQDGAQWIVDRIMVGKPEEIIDASS